MFKELKQHHIGCLVANIHEFKNENKGIWEENDYSDVIHIQSQDVKVCFIKNGGIHLELVEPGPLNDPLKRLLSKGVSYYHLAYATEVYDVSVNNFLAANCRQISEFLSEAFNGKRCSFFYHNQLKLIELIESA